MQEGIARPIGKPHEAKSLIRIVPFDDGLDRGTGGRFKPLGARSQCRSESAPGCFEVVVVEATAARRAKISVSAAHVIPWGVSKAPISEMRKGDRQQFRTAGVTATAAKASSLLGQCQVAKPQTRIAELPFSAINLAAAKEEFVEIHEAFGWQ
jgi:hypothetical protein